MAARRCGFFKVVATQDCLERITIARGYVKYKRGNLPSRVILKDKYGNRWQVQVRKRENEFFFVDGWKQFLEDNHVEIWNIIVFDYGGPNEFNVKVLGNDRCEKIGVGGLRTDLVEAEEEEDEDEDEDEVEVVEEEDEDDGIEMFEQEIEVVEIDSD